MIVFSTPNVVYPIEQRLKLLVASELRSYLLYLVRSSSTKTVHFHVSCLEYLPAQKHTQLCTR